MFSLDNIGILGITEILLGLERGKGFRSSAARTHQTLWRVTKNPTPNPHVASLGQGIKISFGLEQGIVWSV